MPLRVELIDEAIEDLVRYAETNIFPRLLAKLVRLEEVGKDAGQPLGRGLTGWRKIIVGDRDWRIILTNAGDTVATVWVIADRADDACYDEAQRRVNALAKGQPHAASLAAVMLQISQARGAARKAKRGKGKK